MTYLDHHMHSKISFDSKAELEEYLALTKNPIITTEHLDFNDPAGDYVDRIPDYLEHQKWISDLKELGYNNIYQGIEIGWTAISEDKIFDFLKDKKYDLVLLSVHQNGHADYHEKDKFGDVTKEELITQYLQDLKGALLSMKDHVDIMTHFDYGFRVHDVSVEELKEYGEPLLLEIFQLLVDHKIAFEINTSSMYKHQNLYLYEYALPLYQSVGGDRFVLGSDAHHASDYQRRFDDAVLFLKEYDVEEVVQLFSEQKGFKKI